LFRGVHTSTFFSESKKKKKKEKEERSSQFAQTTQEYALNV